LGLECPEPLANLYTRSYFRATWVTTALDAGFWTAMRIRRKWLRDFCSIVFSVYYLIAAEQADEKVRKVRGALTLDHLRVSWNKGTTPYLGFASALLRPRLMKYPPRAIRIPRPPGSDYKEPVKGWLYFDGPLSALKNHTKLVIDIPGGGFVAMDPRTHDDKLFAWAGKTGLPVLSLDYRKAPEFPYPYALNECYDVYHTVIASRGRCVGLSGEVVPKVVLTGDSAGGNLATATILMILESASTETRQYQGEAGFPVPDGLVLMYPGLDLNISNWISDEQMSLIKDRRMRKMNRNMLREKSMQYTHLAGTPHESEVEEDTPAKVTSPPIPGENDSPPTLSITTPSPTGPASQQYTEPEPSPSLARRVSVAPHQPAPLQTRLAMSSMISYFNDRILSPEMMRSMIILYIGPHSRPDFSRDYLLSPILAPDSLLCKFPKTYFLTGERDPMVDDTVIFAGKLRRAKAALHEQEATEKGGPRKEFDEREVVEVALIPGISHGFLQFVGVFPEGWKHLYRTARWIEEIFEHAEEKDREDIPVTPSYTSTESRHHYRTRTESSGDEDFGLEMSMTSSKSKGKASPASKEIEKQREETRRKKERLLKEHLEEQRESRKARGGKDGRGRGRGRVQRKKSMVTLASSEDLLGRRMLGLAGPLTGTGDG
jgi:acetyl esterase/lipase